VADVLQGSPRLIAVLVRASDPGNLGTVIRLADAAGADGVVVGSALIDALKGTLDDQDRATSRSVDAVTTLVKELSEGVRSVSKRAAA
jgi:tRNA G18 (ribose-2'-O)-methylase SpoU